MKITLCVSFPVKYFNFYWQDMTAPTMSLAQNTIRVALTEILKGGKVCLMCDIYSISQESLLIDVT